MGNSISVYDYALDNTTTPSQYSFNVQSFNETTPKGHLPYFNGSCRGTVQSAQKLCTITEEETPANHAFNLWSFVTGENDTDINFVYINYEETKSGKKVPIGKKIGQNTITDGDTGNIVRLHNVKLN